MTLLPNNMRHQNNLERNGFSIMKSVLEPCKVDWILDEITALHNCEGTSTRSGRVFGARNLFQKIPSLRSVAEHEPLISLVKKLIGDAARPVRCLFFDKNSMANWSVVWHQDLTIAVRRRRPVEGFGPWSLKAGVPHVQPPLSILEKMLTLRIHLDKTDGSNGALRVISGSHRLGRLNPQMIEQLTAAKTPRMCAVDGGGVLLMRPLLLHSSRSCRTPVHRRVLHIEFSADRLPGGLEWYGH